MSVKKNMGHNQFRNKISTNTIHQGEASVPQKFPENVLQKNKSARDKGDKCIHTQTDVYVCIIHKSAGSKLIIFFFRFWPIFMVRLVTPSFPAPWLCGLSFTRHIGIYAANCITHLSKNTHIISVYRILHAGKPRWHLAVQ